MAVSIQTRLQRVLPEVVQKGALEFSYAADAFYRYVKTSTERVVPNTEGLIGYDWKVLQPITIGVAGSFRWGNIHTTNEINSNALRQWTLASGQNYPGADEVSLVGFDRLELQLIEGKGNFAFPLHLIQLDMVNALAVRIVSQNVKGVVENKGLAELESFYSSSDTTKQLAQINGAPTFSGGSPVAKSMLTCSVDNGRIYAFRPGMFVDGYISTTKINTSFKVLVAAVDKPGQKLILAEPTGTIDLEAAGFADDTILVREESYGIGLQGLNTWIKSSGTVLGLSVSEIPDLKSWEVSNLAGVLTEDVLNELIAKLVDGGGANKRYAGVTTSEVLLKHFAGLTAFDMDPSGSTAFAAPWQIQRQGQAIERITGYQEFEPGVGIKATCRGKTVPIYASNRQASGVLHIMNVTAGNIKRYVPPKISGMGSHRAFGGEVEFINGYDNGGSIFRNVSATSPSGSVTTATNLVEAPFRCVMNRMAEDPVGMKVSGITEQSALTFV